MWLKVVFGLCFVKTLLQVTEAQRWGKPKNSFNSENSGFSSWESNSGSNAFSNKQNSKYGSWGLNVESNPGTTPDPFKSQNSNSFGMNSYDKPMSSNSNWNRYDTTTETKKQSNWDSSYGINSYDKSTSNSNVGKNTFSNVNTENSWYNNVATTESRRPSNWNSNFGSNKNDNPTFGQNSNFNTNAFSSNNGNDWTSYDTTTEKRKKLEWSSNKSTTSKTPKKKKPNSGSSENRETEAFNSNNTPGEKKLASIMNSPSSGKWDSNSNSYSSNTNNNDNSIYSSWEASNTGNSNSNIGWGSNSLDDNDINSNEIFSSSDYDNNAVFSSYDSNKNKKPATATTSWESSNGNSKNDKNSGSSLWSLNNNKQNNNRKPTNSYNPNNQDSNNWDSNENRPKEKNPTTPQPPSSQDQNQPSQKKDHSVLDELDQNEWYFGSASNYPSPPFRSSLDIDVSELWNFDKNIKSGGSANNGNKNNNKRRRNRQAEDYDAKTQCTCVDVTLCEEEDMIISQYDLKDVWRPLEEFQCQRLTEVCCTNPKIKESTRSNILLSDSLHCGQRKIVKTFNVLSETVAQPGEFPWNLKISGTQCGASLIHPQMALTAAHCVESVSPNSLKVKAGLWNANNEPYQTRRIMNIILHPDYSSTNPRNDIALLVLEKGFDVSDNVNTVCLPVTNDKWEVDECVVAGWRPKEINGEVFEVLEKSTVNFLPQQECQNIMLVTDLWRQYILHDSFVCGIEKNEKIKCLGDEGSPVICPSSTSPDMYLQVGIVSNSMNCDAFGRPGIFTNVLKFLDWVNENAFDLGLFDDMDVRTLV